jgi:hypothetical protein
MWIVRHASHIRSSRDIYFENNTVILPKRLHLYNEWYMTNSTKGRVVCVGIGANLNWLQYLTRSFGRRRVRGSGCLPYGWTVNKQSASLSVRSLPLGQSLNRPKIIILHSSPGIRTCWLSFLPLVSCEGYEEIISQSWSFGNKFVKYKFCIWFRLISLYYIPSLSHAIFWLSFMAFNLIDSSVIKQWFFNCLGFVASNSKTTVWMRYLKAHGSKWFWPILRHLEC